MAGEAAYRPQLWHQLCFNADPNDPYAVPLWTDYTAMVRKIGENKRGRNYELAQSLAASPVITWRDPNEILNPANTSSVQYPNVEPYRQVLSQAMWPNPPVAGQVNLINSGRWKANNAVAPDPSFESYANGAALPGWLTAVGATVPTVTTTNPQQGTKSLTYAVASVTTQQGVSWTADCVPGQQYTTSAYVRQSTGSTQRLTVGNQTLLYDTFDRTSASGWGSSTSGAAWTCSGGSAADFSVGSSKGSHSNASVNVQRFSIADSAGDDVNVVVSTVLPVTPAGASVTRWLLGRAADTSNYYSARLTVTTSNVVSLGLVKTVAGTPTAIVADVTLGVQTPGDPWSIRLECAATTIRARAWLGTDLEPSTWTCSVTDTAITTGTNIGVITRLETGNTNGTFSTTFDSLMCSGTIASTTTTTTGSYVRLSKTFIATQPLQTITVATVGAATAGTVNVDAVQHELGASASSFVTTGPVIYPLLRDYIERFPREYEAAGFVGIAATPAVDGFAALNAISIPSDYAQAVLALNPYGYWPLSGGVSTLQALDQSGHGRPSLSQFDSKYGAGVAPAFGTQIDIAGDAGATGVTFSGLPPFTSPQADSILSLGRVPGDPQLAFPSAYTSTWGASIAAWISWPDPAAGASGQLIAYPVALTQPFSTVPLFLQMFGSFPRAVIQGSGGGQVEAIAATAMTSDSPHLLVATVNQISGGNTLVSLYLDGALIDTGTGTTASLGGLFTAQANVMNIGGSGVGGSSFEGTIAHVALWERELSAAEVTGLWTAGGLGNAGETTGTRLARHLAGGRYAGATRISTGLTTLEPPTFQDSIDLLSDAQNLALAEQGTLWVAPDGALVFEGRSDRWLRLTSIATLGEDTASSETPYLDGILFDNDPTFVYASVLITRNGGSTARGGTQAQINVASRKYFGRSYAIGADFETDTIAQYAADYIFNTHRATVQRVGRIVIDPGANPALWPVALSLEVGQRITVKRRAKAANSGAGLTMSADYFIESVAHSELDMDGSRWLVGFMLSPVGSVSAGQGVSFQPWILEDTTYGVLDSTTILGW